MRGMGGNQLRILTGMNVTWPREQGASIKEKYFPETGHPDQWACCLIHTTSPLLEKLSNERALKMLNDVEDLS